MNYDKLEKTIVKSDKIPWINHGGCAINAVAIYDFINDNFPELNPQILYHHTTCYEENEIAIANNDLNNILCGHAYVSVQIDGATKYIESSGIYDEDDELRCDGEIEYDFYHHKLVPVTRELCVDHINSTTWNSYFSRRNVVKIDKIFGTNLRSEIDGVSA